MSKSHVTAHARGFSLRPGDVVSFAPRPIRPPWYRLLLIVPWIAHRRAMRSWLRDSVRTVSRVVSSTTIEIGGQQLPSGWNR